MEKSKFVPLVLLLYVSTFLSVDAFAGGVRLVGSGGDVVVCESDDGSKKYQILDVYEGQIIDPAMPNFDDLVGDEFSRARKLAFRLASKGPLLTEMILNYISLIENKGLKFVNGSIFDIKDSKHTLEPKSKKCKIEQLAVQTFELIRLPKIYYVNELIWNELELNQKAIIILHEAIFSIYIENQSFSADLKKMLLSSKKMNRDFALSFANSVGVRKLVWLMVTNKISQMSTYEYFKFLLSSALGDKGEVHHIRNSTSTERRFVSLSLDWEKAILSRFTFDKNGELFEVVTNRTERRKKHTPNSIYIDIRPSNLFLTATDNLKNIAYQSTVARLYCNNSVVKESLNSIEEFDSSKGALALALMYLDKFNRFSTVQSAKYKSQLEKVYNSIRWKTGVKILNNNRGEIVVSTRCATKNIFTLEPSLSSYTPLTADWELSSASNLNFIVGDQELWSILPVEEQALALMQIVFILNIQPNPTKSILTVENTFEDFIGMKVHSDTEELALRWARLLTKPGFELVTDKKYIEIAMENNFEFYWDSVKVFLNYNSTTVPGLSILESALADYGVHHTYRFTQEEELLGIDMDYDSGMVGINDTAQTKFNLLQSVGLHKSKKNPEQVIITLGNGCLRMSGEKIFEDPTLKFEIEETSRHSFYRRTCIE